MRSFTVFGSIGLIGIACDDRAKSRDEPTFPAPAERPDSRLTAPSSGLSSCFECAEALCPQSLEECELDPSCAVYARCVLACPVTRDQRVERACVAECAPPKSSIGREAAKLVASCVEAIHCDSCLDPVDDAGTGEPSMLPDEDLNCSARDPENPCLVCLEESCCADVHDCRTNPVCQRFQDCINDCIDRPGSNVFQCRSECTGQIMMTEADAGPAVGETEALHTAREYFRIIDCARVRCTAQCADDEPCTICVAEQCGELSLRCSADDVCHDLELCVSSCTATDGSCVQTCSAKYPEAAELYEEYLDCFLNCAEECG